MFTVAPDGWYRVNVLRDVIGAQLVDITVKALYFAAATLMRKAMPNLQLSEVLALSAVVMDAGQIPSGRRFELGTV